MICRKLRKELVLRAQSGSQVPLLWAHHVNLCTSPRGLYVQSLVSNRMGPFPTGPYGQPVTSAGR